MDMLATLDFSHYDFFIKYVTVKAIQPSSATKVRDRSDLGTFYYTLQVGTVSHFPNIPSIVV